MKFFLTGLAGVGKSYMGKRWSETYGLPFFDLDERIETKAGKSITTIFEEQGEEAFREIEHQALLDFSTIPSGLIACGGGTPCFHDNMNWMNEHGTTLWLQRPLENILENIEAVENKRPLLQQNETISQREILENLLVKRKKFYSLARFKIDLSGNYEADLKNIFSTHA